MKYITNCVAQVYKSSTLPTKRCLIDAEQIVNVIDSRFGRDQIDAPVKGWILHGLLRPFATSDPLRLRSMAISKG